MRGFFASLRLTGFRDSTRYFKRTRLQEEGMTMDSIQQILTSGSQVANSAGAVAHSLAKPRAAATTGTSGTTGSSSSTDPTASTAGSTISANDFLTLLVAEMKNQDPTQPTDPNAYITQMVNVNSLQQLIGINQGVSTLDTSVGGTTTPTTGASAVGATGETD
jgi:flagellar basal-body rod modification protein FlgD